jgi:hypothetical protein
MTTMRITKPTTITEDPKVDVLIIDAPVRIDCSVSVDRLVVTENGVISGTYIWEFD